MRAPMWVLIDKFNFVPERIVPCHNYYILKQHMIVFGQAICPIVFLNDLTHNQSTPSPDEDLMKTPDEDLIKLCWTGLLSGWVTLWIISLCCTSSFGSQAGVADINHAFHLYYKNSEDYRTSA